MTGRHLRTNERLFVFENLFLMAPRAQNLFYDVMDEKLGEGDGERRYLLTVKPINNYQYWLEEETAPRILYHPIHTAVKALFTVSDQKQ